MVRQTVSHYRIVERLGSGGMGVVYRAEDTRLGRQVALKFLPEALTRDREALERFQREARAASALNHPHICTIYDIDEAEGQPFIAMELLEKQTLKARLQGQPRPTAEIVEVGLQLTDALEAAHAKGIIHRDLKPANIFVTTRGDAKLLDFGLAKLAAEPHAASEAPTAAGEWVTGAGVALGTVGYMSPEQVRGEALDARTDLFSLGVVLYEMATGTAPFRGATSGAVLGEILTKSPTAPVRLNPELPADLERLINKALEKDRALRYQSACDLRVDLERLRRTLSAPVGTRPEQPSIVVLPFENLSPDPDNAFFADGLTEELIAELSGIRALRVISRTSAMHYKGTTQPLPAIAQELNVRHVLEGSVRRAGSALRITAQLIDATTDAHLWAERYSGTLDDVFDLQERLARRIVEALKVTLSTREDRRISARPIADPRAYDAWLRARQELWHLTKEGIERGRRLIDEALAVVGDNALLLAGLSHFCWAAYDFGISYDEQTLRDAERFGVRALELAPELPEGHLAIGLARYKRGDMRAMLAACSRTVELAPNPDALFFLGFGLAEVGRIAEARRFADEALARDPLMFLTHFGRAMVDLLDGRAEAALARLRDAEARLAPGDLFPNWWIAQAAAYAGREAEARETFARVAAMRGGIFSDMSELARRALDGDREGVAQTLDTTTLRQVASTDDWYPNLLATYLARVGEYDETLHWLEKALAFGFSNHRFWAEHNRFLTPLRGDPRFEALIERAREKERAFEG